MFVFLLFVLPIVLPAVVTIFQDPAPGISQTKDDTRNLDCQRLSEAQAQQLYPGLAPETSARATGWLTTSTVACQGRIMDLDERNRRDEAVLSSLYDVTSEFAEVASERDPSLRDKTWLVEAFYPDPSVAAKISFATKTALVSRGRKVSDRVPVLAAADVLVLARLGQDQVYRAACQRYRAEAAMSDDDVLLALVLRDARATVLHAGVCSAGEWRWLR